MEPTTGTESKLDLVWGAEAIGRELNLSKRQVFYILETGKLPAKKVGRQWVTSRVALRKFFADLAGAAA